MWSFLFVHLWWMFGYKLLPFRINKISRKGVGFICFLFICEFNCSSNAFGKCKNPYLLPPVTNEPRWHVAIFELKTTHKTSGNHVTSLDNRGIRGEPQSYMLIKEISRHIESNNFILIFCKSTVTTGSWISII